MTDVTLDLIYQKTLQVEQLVKDLPGSLSVIHADQIYTNFLSAISANLGTVTAGEVRVGTPNVRPGEGFSGLRIKWPPMDYLGEQWNLVGLNNDVFQVGIRTSDGTLRAGAGNIIIDLDGIRSANYVSGVSGFAITQPNGDAEFHNITARGEFHAAVFVKDMLDVRAGQMYITKSAGKLSNDMVVPTVHSWLMYISDPPGGGFLFANNDICQIRQIFSGSTINLYFTVSSRHDMGDGRQRYTCTWGSGDRSVERTYTAGNAVMDRGQSGDGYLYMASGATGADGPFYSARTWVTNPWTLGNITEWVRLGNVRNSFGTGANNRYGFGVGNYAGGNYLSYNAEDTNKFILKAGAGNITLSETGIDLVAGSSESTSYVNWLFGGRLSGFLYNNVVATGSWTRVYARRQSGDSWSHANASIQAEDTVNNRVGEFRARSHTSLQSSFRSDITGSRDHMFKIYADSTGTTTAGYGASILLHAKVGGTSDINVGYLASVWTDIANRHSKFEFGLMRSGTIATRMEMTPDDFYSIPWTDYSATSTVTGWAAGATVEIFYKKVGRLVFVQYHITGTSNSTSTNFTLPYEMANSVRLRTFCQARDNAAWQDNPWCGIDLASRNIARFVRSPSGAYTGWTDVGTKMVAGQFFYEATS